MKEVQSLTQSTDFGWWKNCGAACTLDCVEFNRLNKKQYAINNSTAHPIKCFALFINASYEKLDNSAFLTCAL